LGPEVPAFVFVNEHITAKTESELARSATEEPSKSVEEEKAFVKTAEEEMFTTESAEKVTTEKLIGLKKKVQHENLVESTAAKSTDEGNTADSEAEEAHMDGVRRRGRVRKRGLLRALQKRAQVLPDT